MDTASREQIKHAVLGVIRSLTRDVDLDIDEKYSINVSTLLYGDDFGNLFIMEIEDLLRIKVSVHEWAKVYTVGDAIDLLAREQRKSTGPLSSGG